MFSIAILIGIYSYTIFLFGLLGILYKTYVISAAFIYILIILYFYEKKIKINLLKCFETFKKIQKLNLDFIKLNLLLTVALSIVVLQGIINLIGALGPELGFDALWYHLTIPKIYLENHSIFYIPGGLLYYSAMPRLAEMLYIAGLSFGTEIFPKLIHFSFGILSLIVLYKLSRKFLTKTFSLIVLVLFYSNLVVGWMSITAYVDLVRTFFEIMALLGFLNWWEKGSKKWLIFSAIILGLAISTKVLAIGSLFVFTVLIVYSSIRKIKFKWKILFTNILIYCWFSIFIPLPWFIFSFIHTESPVYPFFTGIYPVNLSIELIDPIKFTNDIWSIFTKSADPISPIYIIFLPSALFLYKKFPDKIKIICIYSFLIILVWYITPRTGGGRFILPYLPIFSIVCVFIIEQIKNFKIRLTFIIFIIFLASFSVLYRGVANLKYLPVILGKESKDEFLSNNLNFSFGDFYDTDEYLSKKIKQKDKVLLYGFHNLYYVNFPFIDSSFVKKGDQFNYIAVQGSNLPERFKIWNLIYYNEKTKVKLYSAGGIRWVY